MALKELTFLLLLCSTSRVLSLSCPGPCLRSDCDLTRTSFCTAGLTKDVCGCCDECAKGVGEVCGGPWNTSGFCGKGLFCRKKHLNIPSSEFNAEGKCMKDLPGCENGESTFCTFDQIPTCGSNGVKYQSMCEFAHAQCKNPDLMEAPCDVRVPSCIEGTWWKVDCNDCSCNNGIAACTEKGCLPKPDPGCPEPLCFCEAGEEIDVFIKDNGCNGCRCFSVPKWTPVTKSCIIGHNNLVLDNIFTLGDCKYNCENENGFSCSSVEYHPRSDRCVLSDTHSSTNLFSFRTQCPSTGWEFTELSGISPPIPSQVNNEFTIGRETFAILRDYYKGTTWDQANSACIDQGYDLAEPDNLVSLARYLKQNHNLTYYWLGGHGTGFNVKWLSGQVISRSSLWRTDYETSRNYCLYLRDDGGSKPIGSYPCLDNNYLYPLCEVRGPPPPPAAPAAPAAPFAPSFAPPIAVAFLTSGGSSVGAAP